jgi:aromatic-L-amino-acid decarboxylase
MQESRLPGFDQDLEQFRAEGHALIEWIAEFLAHPERYAVLPATRPGDVRAALPAAAPLAAEPLAQAIADFKQLIVPNTTQWNHPGFMAYFATSGSPPGILGELAAAALNVNAMVWRSGPAQTELEEVTLDWFRQMIGLPPEFDGTINDTASSSTLYALAAAREHLADLRLRQEGLAGRLEVPRLRVYCSEEAHSSVDKAVITLGLGLEGVRHIATGTDYALEPTALSHAIEQDIRAGVRPMAVVATVGTTSTTAIDPVVEVAAVCARHNIWLHVDAAYGGTAAILPELRWILNGCERAHSLVVNPHKWLFVPMDCSVLYTRSPELLRAAFSLTPDYLKTPEAGSARNLMDYGVSLGRRFRALKLWFVLRAYGVEGVQRVIREHLRIARLLAGWVDGAAHFERVAPTRFSVVVFRHLPPAMAGDAAALDAHNLALLDRINASGRFFLSHTRAKGRLALRVAIGNQRTGEADVRALWDTVQACAAQA